MRYILLTITFNIVFSVALSEENKFRRENLTEQKDVIWGFDFLTDKKIIFTERNGAIKILDLTTKQVTNISGAPAVWNKGQGGLLDIRVHPKNKNQIYLTYSEPVGKDEATTAIGIATLEGDKLTQFRKIFSADKPSDEKIHFGSRIEFDGKGYIFVTIGERNNRPHAQQLNYHTGKIIRLKEDGSVPTDNPFTKDGRTKSEIWSYGHRNSQGLVIHPQTGDLWSTEMGPRGGDELNLIKPGINYGWPEATYGREYYGPKIGETSKKDMEQPVAYWVPSISPSGTTVYNGDAFPKWKGNIFIGTLSGEHLRRVVLNGQKVSTQEELLKGEGLRIRNLRTGPDGFLYLSTDSGFISRLVPVK